MQKRDFETYQKRFRDFEILLKFSETHVFRGTIRHPYNYTPFQTKTAQNPWVAHTYNAYRGVFPPYWGKVQHILEEHFFFFIYAYFTKKKREKIREPQDEKVEDQT